MYICTMYKYEVCTFPDRPVRLPVRSGTALCVRARACAAAAGLSRSTMDSSVLEGPGSPYVLVLCT